MKKFKIYVEKLARQDIIEAVMWYNSQQKGLGQRLKADLKHMLVSVAVNPTSFGIRYRKVRLANLSIFPFAIHFLIDESLQWCLLLKLFILQDNQA